jgi:Tfp pilus assembly protein PilF
MFEKKTIAWIFILGFCGGCSSVRTKEWKGKPVEYSAWFEEESDSGLQAYRKILSEKVEEVENETDDASNVEKHLDYLANLDASGKKSNLEAKLKEFIAKNPNEKRGQFLLGVHYMRNKRKELAYHFFSNLEKDPKFSWKSLLFNNLGMMSLQDKDRDKAMGYFEKAIAAEPAIAAPRVNLGSLYLQSKSYNDALPLFKKAMELDPDFEEAYLGYGVCLEAQGKFEEAHQVYVDFSAGHSNSLSVLFNDATILGKYLGKKEEAAELMLRYIQRGGKDTGKAHELIQGWH